MRVGYVLAATCTAALLVAASSASAATTFDGSYTETHNAADPGLVIQTQAINSNFSFSLNQGGHTSVDLFNISTNEDWVNADDKAPSAIDVVFNFTAPDVFGGQVNGSTVGQSFGFLGAIQDGKVTWNNGGTAVLDFGNGGELKVKLNDATFDAGVFGLGNLQGGAVISAKFTELKAATVAAAAPEPGTWAIMLTGLFGVGAVIRRNRKGSALAAATAA